MAHQFSPGDRVQCIDWKLSRLKGDVEYVVQKAFNNSDTLDGNVNPLVTLVPPPEHQKSWVEGMGPYSARRFIPAEIQYDPTQMGDREDDI
jgi:hypothetical protein